MDRQLFREIGLLPSTLVVVGNIIGVGIFTTSGLIAEQLGTSWWLLGVWILGGLLALIGAICYSVLSIHIPRAGGEYAFLYPSYGPFAAFLAGWTSLLIGFSAPIAASALGLAHYLAPLLPFTDPKYPPVLKGIAGLTLLVVTLLLSVGLKFGSRVHSLITILNLALALGFAAATLGNVPASQNLKPILSDFSLGFDLPSLGTAVVLVMFAYSGWNAAAYLAEEIRQPERYVPRALILGTVTVIAIYMLMNLAFLGAVPASKLAGKIPVAQITSEVAFGTWGNTVVNVLILFCILSSITAMSIAGPRVYFAMSRDHLFPKWLAQVHKTRKIPLKSIWFQCSLAIVLIGLGSLRDILIYSGSILLFFATLTTSTLLTKTPRTGGSLSLWILYRTLPCVFIVVNSVVLASAAVSNPRQILAGIATLVVGIPVYFYYRRGHF